MEKLKISQAIIVEGKYDKIKLSSFVDAVIICTNGFGIFKDKKKAELIRLYAKKNGIIILTDSDTAGFKIRGHIKGICPSGKITNVYIPEIFGKEKRKTEPSKEGKLGVEGMDIEILRKAFEKAGIMSDSSPKGEPVTKMDFYELGFSGGAASSELRKKLCAELGLPQLMTAGALLETVNAMFDRSEFYAVAEKITKGGEV